MCDFFVGKAISALFLYCRVVGCSQLVIGSLEWFGSYCVHSHPPTPPSVSVPPFDYLRCFESDVDTVKSNIETSY